MLDEHELTCKFSHGCKASRMFLLAQKKLFFLIDKVLNKTETCPYAVRSTLSLLFLLFSFSFFPSDYQFSLSSKIYCPRSWEIGCTSLLEPFFCPLSWSLSSCYYLKVYTLYCGDSLLSCPDLNHFPIL